MVKLARDKGLRKTTGDILKAIYLLRPDGGRSGASSDDTNSESATTLTIARRTGTSAPFVTKMLKQLQGDGMVIYVPYHGASLTPEGRRIAVELSRHHRLLERFLTDFLLYAPDEAHDEAEALEHVISERFEARLAEFMGNPTTCPHGSPIPDADLSGLPVAEDKC